MSTWKKDQKERFGVTDFSAMSLVPFLVFAHYEDDMEDIIKEKSKEAKHPIRILRDGQAIMIEDDNTTFVGEGEEVRL
jgi:peptidase E